MLFQNTSTYSQKKVGYKVFYKHQNFSKTQYFFPVLIQFTKLSQPGKEITKKKCQKFCYTNAHWVPIKKNSKLRVFLKESLILSCHISLPINLQPLQKLLSKSEESCIGIYGIIFSISFKSVFNLELICQFPSEKQLDEAFLTIVYIFSFHKYFL